VKPAFCFSVASGFFQKGFLPQSEFSSVSSATYPRIFEAGTRRGLTFFSAKGNLPVTWLLYNTSSECAWFDTLVFFRYFAFLFLAGLEDPPRSKFRLVVHAVVVVVFSSLCLSVSRSILTFSPPPSLKRAYFYTFPSTCHTHPASVAI